MINLMDEKILNSVDDLLLDKIQKTGLKYNVIFCKN